MEDYRGTPLRVGDKVAVFYGYGMLETAFVTEIKNGRCKLKVHYYYNTPNEHIVDSKWRDGFSMVKID